MLHFLLALLLWSTASPALQPAPPVSFERTMRVDYFHTGGQKSGETFALDRVVNDGRWPGSRTQLVDATGLGPYRFEVRDVASGALRYSRGFASIYGEWETTGEAPKLHRTFHESVRFPWPLAPVRVTIQRRNAANAFADVWTTEVDPGSRFVNSGSPAPRGNVWNVIDSGPPERKVDLLVLGEGYTQAEMAKFHGDVKRLVDALFAQEPFRGRRLPKFVDSRQAMLFVFDACPPPDMP